MTTAERAARILVAGEIKVDFVFRGCHALPMPGKEVLADDFVMTPGSSSMIRALGLAKLGNDVAFHGRLGVDASGEFCSRALREAAIDTSSLRPDASLRKTPWRDCMRWGSACGSLSTRGMGGTAAQATTNDVVALMAGGP